LAASRPPCQICGHPHCGEHEHWGRYYANYIPPSFEKINGWIIAFKAAFNRVCDDLKIDSSQYIVDVKKMREVYERTDKRYLHYLMYYNGMQMDEIKRLAEIIFWSARLNAITQKSDSNVDESVRILTGIFTATIIGICKRKGYVFGTLDDKAHDYLVYALQYRELSRDALVMLAEGLIARNKTETAAQTKNQP